jgi:site-specific DNA recombinase
MDRNGDGLGINRQFRVVAYIRMSSDKQDASPERQWQQISSHATRSGYTISEIYSDLGIAGDERVRPEFLRLLTDARAGKIDVILIDEPSRLSRTRPSEFIAESIYPLAQTGVRLETVSSGDLSWDTIAELIMVTIHAHHSTTEVRNMSRRTLDGMANLVRKGWWHGDVPLGYVLAEKRDILDPGRITSRHLAPGDPRLVKAVRLAFRAYASGRASYSQIAIQLASRGIVSKERRGDLAGKPITPRGIMLMLRNRAYVGDTIWNKNSNGKYTKLINGKAEFQPYPGTNAKQDWIAVPNTHAPLITRTLFQAVENRLTGLPKRKVPRLRADYAFSKLLICGDCGSRMSGHSRKGKTGVVKTYGCRTYKEYGPSLCNSNVVKESALLSLIASTIRTELNNSSGLRQVSPPQPLVAKYWHLLITLEQGTTLEIREAFGALFDRVKLRFMQHHHKVLTDSILLSGEMFLRQIHRSNSTAQTPRLTFHV